jgi:hypothetical protein
MDKKIFLIAVDVKQEGGYVEDCEFRKVLADDKAEAKQIVFKELSAGWDFEDFEEFDEFIMFCNEINTTTPNQSFGC